MSITITLTNPAEHAPSELRALAHMLQCMATDKEGGSTVYPRPTRVYDFEAGVTVAETEVPRAPALRTSEDFPGAGVEPVSVLQTEQVVARFTRGPTGEIPASPFTAAPGASAGTAEMTEAGADAEGEPNTTDTDLNGVKWDARIHSETRSTNKDGSWRQKRGVDPDLVKAVLAEQMGATGDDASTVSLPAGPVPFPTAPAAPAAPVAPAPVAPPAPAAPATVAPADVVRFVTLNKISPEQAIPVYQTFGLANAAALFTQPDLAPAVLEALKALVA
ncbi:hypothetical protein D3C78_412260 [compost metagenome]